MEWKAPGGAAAALDRSWLSQLAVCARYRGWRRAPVQDGKRRSQGAGFGSAPQPGPRGREALRSQKIAEPGLDVRPRIAFGQDLGRGEEDAVGRGVRRGRDRHL